MSDGTRFDPPKGEVSFEGVTVRNVDFHGTSWDRFWASDSTFIDCDFREVRLSAAGARSTLGAYRGRTLFRGCRFDSADLGNIDPGAARFERCRFDGAQIESWLSFLAEYVDCHFAGRIVETIFSGQPFGPGANVLKPRRAINEFRGNDFRDAELIDCSFVRGIDLDLQLSPTGEDYVRLDRARERIATAKDRVQNWADPLDRDAALVMLAVYSTGGYESQDEIFVHRYNLVPTVSRIVTDRVWELLKQL